MSIDPTEATAAATTRRSFLVRAALGGALVTVATTAGPLTRLLPVAGAQEADLQAAPELDAETFAALAVPLEMAAVQAYQAALEGGSLDDGWTDNARTFQSHHQAVVDALTPLISTDAGTPVPDELILTGTVEPLRSATDQNAILTALAELEDVLAATHLYAVGGLDDGTLAKTVSQVLAVESQQAVVLARSTGADLVALTPPAASTAAARTEFDEALQASTTTTTSTTEAEG